MTENQKMIVAGLRKTGMGYGTIAKKVGVSVNTIKSFCHRRAAKPKREEPDSRTHRCLCCGVPVAQNPGRKEKKFCSDKCRNKWWNARLDLVNRKAFREIVCVGCGRTFTVYGQVKRKFCSHQCYIEARFGRDDHEQEAASR